ncbi:MAG: hypothetical protein J5716_01185 [Alphaproteobacteria bacterium]|nr:hypothetical protein [Alphaproteobacteria bacterium]
MKKLFLAVFFLMTGCQLPIEKDIPVSVDSYLRKVPAVKTAIIHLKNEKMSKDDIEYLQFFDKLKPILTAKGYRLTNPAAVILRLEFGVKKEKQVSIKSAIDTAEYAHPVDEPSVLPTTQYNRLDVYEKYITLTAVQADKAEQPLWKTTVSLKDYASDFRSAQDKLLYLLSHFIEKDSGQQISANLTDTEFYQRYALNFSAAEASALFVTEPEMRRRYLRELQIRVDAHAADFKKCGLTEKREIAFTISPFGTLPSFGFKETFNLSGKPISEKIRSCIAQYFEPLLEPPHGLDTTQPMSIVIPIR